MIKKILNIVDKNFIKVDILNSVRRMQDISYEKNTKCFAAYDNDKMVGIVMQKDLVVAHPNRIVADVMCEKYCYISGNSHIWKAAEMFDLNKDIEVIFVEDEDDIIGYVTRGILKAELEKHIDLLTGLYKSDYMFYNAYKLIRSDQNTTIIFIDMDRFGHIDKEYGHITGDIILKNVAAVLSDSIPSDVYLCRYAGDEFAIVTPYSIEESKVLAERIIKKIDSYEFPNNIPVSVSIGITGCKVHCEKINSISEFISKLVNIASLASTKAKQSVNKSIIIGDLDIDAIA